MMIIYFIVLFVNIVVLVWFCISHNTFKHKNNKTKYYVAGVEYDSLEKAEQAKQYLLNTYKKIPGSEKYLKNIMIVKL